MFPNKDKKHHAFQPPFSHSSRLCVLCGMLWMKQLSEDAHFNLKTVDEPQTDKPLSRCALAHTHPKLCTIIQPNTSPFILIQLWFVCSGGPRPTPRRPSAGRKAIPTLATAVASRPQESAHEANGIKMGLFPARLRGHGQLLHSPPHSPLKPTQTVSIVPKKHGPCRPCPKSIICNVSSNKLSKHFTATGQRVRRAGGVAHRVCRACRIGTERLGSSFKCPE